MAAGRRLALVQQAMLVWKFTDDKADLGTELSAFVEEGMFCGESGEVMPYNPQVLEAIVAAGLWEK
jgi:hypothetical protein